MKRDLEVLVLGSGIAGLSAAHKFAEKGARVRVICKANISEGATKYSQGGISAVWAKNDSFEEHIKDTVVAGDGLCREDAVKICIEEGPSRVRELITHVGVDFTKSEESHTPKASSAHTNNDINDLSEVYSLHKEGGHGKRRILHSKDQTGLAIQTALEKKALQSEMIQISEYHMVVDLIVSEEIQVDEFGRSTRCQGVILLDLKTGKTENCYANIVILATGGSGALYHLTSNPATGTGDGIAVAWRAGAKIANMEFVQFHPTCFYHASKNPAERNFLITEALRGEGAILKTIDGSPFMHEYHPLGSLALRDVVARSIHKEMKKGNQPYVLLDCTQLTKSNSGCSSEELPIKFPNIYETCLKNGVDIVHQPIPVAPGAHYHCGGVWVDLNSQTTVKDLYAVGEVSYTGLHGANRLASNSLLEAVVFAHRAVEHAFSSFQSQSNQSHSGASAENHNLYKNLKEIDENTNLTIKARIREMRKLMWTSAGIIRSSEGLQQAQARLKEIQDEFEAAEYSQYSPTRDLIEFRNIQIVSSLIVRSALLRKESRGAHFTSDFPERDDINYKNDTVLQFSASE